MGKHDMKNEVKFSWEPMPDDFYRARITTLEKENLALREKVEKLTVDGSVIKEYRQAVKEANDAYVKEIIEEHQEEIRDMEDTIHELEYQIEKLKEAVVLAALREV
jgi:chromosome segregation ATPase